MQLFVCLFVYLFEALLKIISRTRIFCVPIILFVVSHQEITFFKFLNASWQTPQHLLYLQNILSVSKPFDLEILVNNRSIWSQYLLNFIRKIGRATLQWSNIVHISNKYRKIQLWCLNSTHFSYILSEKEALSSNSELSSNQLFKYRSQLQ